MPRKKLAEESNHAWVEQKEATYEDEILNKW